MNFNIYTICVIKLRVLDILQRKFMTNYGI